LFYSKKENSDATTEIIMKIDAEKDKKIPTLYNKSLYMVKKH